MFSTPETSVHVLDKNREISPLEREEGYGGKDLEKRWVLRREWKILWDTPTTDLGAESEPGNGGGHSEVADWQDTGPICSGSTVYRKLLSSIFTNLKATKQLHFHMLPHMYAQTSRTALVLCLKNADDSSSWRLTSVDLTKTQCTCTSSPYFRPVVDWGVGDWGSCPGHQGRGAPKRGEQK